jgi:hypothetical protein
MNKLLTSASAAVLVLCLSSAAIGASPVTITDPNGTNQATVKPASTTPVATDPALVVTLSPNGAPISTVPSGTQAVSNSGTFAVQAAQSGTWLVGVNPGTALIGKVGIDQTTPGTTNGVQTLSGSTTVVTGTSDVNVKNINGVAVTVNAGAADAGTQRVALATGAAVATTATNPSTIYSGQQAVTASAVALPSQALVNGTVITAPSTNTTTVYVGPAGVTSATGYALAPGTSISYAVTNLSGVFVVGTVGASVSFTGN